MSDVNKISTNNNLQFNFNSLSNNVNSSFDITKIKFGDNVQDTKVEDVDLSSDLFDLEKLRKESEKIVNDNPYLKQRQEYFEIVNILIEEKKDLEKNFGNKDRIKEINNDIKLLDLAIQKIDLTMSINPYLEKWNSEDYKNFQEIPNLENPYYNDKVITASSIPKILSIKSDLENLKIASEVNPELGKMYNYLFQTEGVVAANLYLERIKDTVNQTVGEKNAKEFLDSLKGNDNALNSIIDHINVHKYGLESGIETYFNGLKEWLLESDRVYSSHEYEIMYILEGLKDPKYQSLLDNNFEISLSIGNMAPSIAISLINPMAGSVSMGVSAAGNSTHSALVEGKKEIDAITYGVIIGVSEATLEKAIGGLPGLSNTNVTGLKSFAKSMLSEGIEEGTQEYLDALMRAGIFKDEIDLLAVTENASKSAVYGTITAGMLQGSTLTINKINENIISSNQNINNLNSSAIKIEDLKYSKHTLVDSVSKTLESNLKKYVYCDTNKISGLNNKIKEEGLYHFTSSVDKIIDNGFINPSGIISSYGTPKVFFFAGIPSVGAYATNLDSIPLTTTAVKIMPNSEVLNSSNFKIRYLDDKSISYNGKFDLTNHTISKEYFILIKVEDELVYKPVSKEIYDNYANTLEGIELQKFLNDKQNVQIIKNDYLFNLHSKKNIGSNEIYNISVNKLDGYLKEIVDDWNSMGQVDLEIGKNIENIFLDANYLNGIHRTPNLNSANKIMVEGLALTGHASSGVETKITDISDLEYNVSFTKQNEVISLAKFFRDIKTTSYYKNYTGTNKGYALIIHIPTDIKDVNELIYSKNGKTYLKPDYIIAQIEVDDANILKSENTIFKDKKTKILENNNIELLEVEDIKYTR